MIVYEGVDEMIAAKIEKRIRDVIEERGDHVSFADLRTIKGFSTEPGEGGYTIEPVENWFVWVSMTLEVLEALRHVVDNKHFHFEPCPYLVYLLDGCTLQMPLVKSARKYKTPHWVPTVIRRGPLVLDKKSKGRQLSLRRAEAKHKQERT